MKPNKLKSFLGVAIIAMLLPTASCDAANPSALAGRWVREDGDRILEFFSSGKVFIFSYSNGYYSNGYRSEYDLFDNIYDWVAENDRLYIGKEVADYNIQGSTLTLTYSNIATKKEVKFKKCNKNCFDVGQEYKKAKQ